MDVFLTLAGMFVSVLLILVILLQRGRGGGLVGALSGLGGQSAFGTKAGDTFTRITIVIAAVWVVLAGISGQVLRSNTDKAVNFEKPDLKTDIQAPPKDGKSSATAKSVDADAETEEDSTKRTTKSESTTDKQDNEKEATESKGDSAKDSSKTETDEKPETPSNDTKEPVKKESEPGSEKSEKKEADDNATKSK